MFLQLVAGYFNIWQHSQSSHVIMSLMLSCSVLESQVHLSYQPHSESPSHVYSIIVAGYFNIWQHSQSLHVNGSFFSHTFIAVKPTDKAKSSVVDLFKSVRESSTPLVPTSFSKSITPITYKNIKGQCLLELYCLKAAQWLKALTFVHFHPPFFHLANISFKLHQDFSTFDKNGPYSKIFM